MNSAPASSPFLPPGTPLPTREELDTFLRHYDLGTLLEFAPGRRGRRGRVTTASGQYWLVGPGMTDDYLEKLLEHLASSDLPIPRVVRGLDGAWIRPLGDYPAALVRWPRGEHLQRFAPPDCARTGRLLARVHLEGENFKPVRGPHRDHRWRRETADRFLPVLSDPDRTLMGEEIRFQGLYRFGDLPQGTIHGAPNRRRLVFHETTGVGLTGFGHACRHALLVDVAIAVNDCCTDVDGRLDADLSGALLSAYHQLRPLRAIERGAWPVLLRLAALDAWLEILLLGYPAEEARHHLEVRIGEEASLQRHWIT